MDLTPYVDALRADLDAAAAAGSDATRDTARLLSGALDASLRLCLVDALSAMAAEVTALGDAGSVEIRMHGREPQVVVLPGGPAAEPTAELPPAGAPAPDLDDDGTTARVTLRMPEPLKAQAEERAGAEGLSVNAWLVRAVAHAVHGGAAFGQGGSGFPGGHNALFGSRGRRISGFARG